MACKPTLRTRARWQGGGPAEGQLGVHWVWPGHDEQCVSVGAPPATRSQTAADLAWLQMPPRAPTIMLHATPSPDQNKRLAQKVYAGNQDLQ